MYTCYTTVLQLAILLSPTFLALAIVTLTTSCSLSQVTWSTLTLATSLDVTRRFSLLPWSSTKRWWRGWGAHRALSTRGSGSIVIMHFSLWEGTITTLNNVVKRTLGFFIHVQCTCLFTEKMASCSIFSFKLTKCIEIFVCVNVRLLLLCCWCILARSLYTCSCM